VSSTFDSIPFVANFLQKEIEHQLRGLLMDELPAIIHRLSLRLWVPADKAHEERELGTKSPTKDEVVVDPLASPPQDPVDSTGAALSPAEVANLSLDSSVETQSLFSRKNLIRLATLTDSHRTLSLFTPTMRDTVFRAWTGPLERGDVPGLNTRAATPTLSRTHSYTGSMSTAPSAYTLETSSTSRPGLQTYASASTGLSLASGRHGQGHKLRKKKKRIVDLRPHPETGEPELVVEDGSTADTTSVSESASDAPSVFSAPAVTMSSGPSRSLDAASLPQTPVVAARQTSASENLRHRATDIRSVSEGMPGPSVHQSETYPEATRHMARAPDPNATIRGRSRRTVPAVMDDGETPRASMYLPEHKERAVSQPDVEPRLQVHEKPGGSRPPLPNFLSFVADPSNAGSIAERAWMMKMANEMAKRYEEERLKGHFGESTPRDEERLPPPAYAQ
jgi:distribution and morphology protein 34